MKKYLLLFLSALCFNAFANAQTLDEYFQLAAENNPGLQSEYKNFEAALQKVAQVGSLPDPVLSFGYFISPVETRVGPQRAKFSLSQMFPWFGTLKAQENAASLLAEAKYQVFLDARNTLYYQVAAAYYPLIELEQLILLEKENLRILDSYKDIATAQFQNGKGTMIDVLRVDMMGKDAGTHLSILNQKKKPFETRFNRILNRADNSAINLLDTLAISGIAPNYRRDSLFTENPMLENLDRLIQANEMNEEIAIKQGMPKIGVGLEYVIVGERKDITMDKNGRDIFMPMVSVSLPIYRAKYRAAQKEAQYMQESYTLKKEELSNTLIRSYDRIYFEIQEQLALVQLYEEQIQTASQSLALLIRDYSHSGTQFEEVLRMQQQVLAYQKMKATALSQYHISIAELDYITAKTF